MTGKHFTSNCDINMASALKPFITFVACDHASYSSDATYSTRKVVAWHREGLASTVLPS